MSKLKKLRRLNQEQNGQQNVEERSNYHLSFRTAIYNLEHNTMDEKVPILRKLA